MSEENKNIDVTQSLHTLEGDLLASTKDENYASNIVKIVTHDKEETGVANKKTEKEEAGPSRFSKIKFSINLNSTATYIGISVFFIAFISLGSYYFIHTTIQNTLPQTTPEPITTTSVTTPTSTSSVSKPVLQANGIFSADMVIPLQVVSYNKKLFIDKINEIKTNLTKNNIKDNIDISINTDLSLDNFLDKIQYSGPESLLRSFDAEKSYNFGLYHTQGDQYETYFLTKIDVFDLAFSGMLDWERSMPLDFEKIYTYTVATSSNSSNVSTTTPVFTDKVIKNIDTRTYIDTKKGIRITYGIVNKQYLLITSGENSFVDIVNKLLIRNILH